jgi:hypothetical protein
MADLQENHSHLLFKRMYWICEKCWWNTDWNLYIFSACEEKGLSNFFDLWSNWKTDLKFLLVGYYWMLEKLNQFVQFLSVIKFS